MAQKIETNVLNYSPNNSMFIFAFDDFFENKIEFAIGAYETDDSISYIGEYEYNNNGEYQVKFRKYLSGEIIDEETSNSTSQSIFSDKIVTATFSIEKETDSSNFENVYITLLSFGDTQDSDFGELFGQCLNQKLLFTSSYPDFTENN